MIQRNVELQLQALELLEQKYGITPESFIPHKLEKRFQQRKPQEQDKPQQSTSSSNSEKEVLQDVVKYVG